MVALGIDPGLDGAVAAMNDDGSLIHVWDTPTVTVKRPSGKKRMYLAAEMATILETYKEKFGAANVRVIMESVHAMPKQGGVSNFSMGRGVGIWEGLVAGLRLPLEYVTPQSWKKAAMGAGAGSDKSLSILTAQRLVPSSVQFLKLKKHDGRAEAILIARHLLITNPNAI